MGGSSSREQSTSAFLDYVSSTAVQSQASCIAGAKAAAIIKIDGANNVTFKNVNMDLKSSASAECAQSITVNTRSLNDDLDYAIDALVDQSLKSEDSTVLKSVVHQATTTDNVQSAIATAVSEFTVDVKNQKGDVNVEDFDLVSNASANLTKVLQDQLVTVNGVSTPLPDAVSQTLGNTTSCEDKYPQHLYYLSYTLLVAVVVLLFVVLFKH